MSSTACCSSDQADRVFEVTHPFHPLKGRQFSLVTRKLNWGEDRVMYFNEQGKLRSMPTSWTDVAGADVFVQAAGGRSWFRLDDVFELVALLEAVKSGWRSRRGGVK
jgi:hypothetical protein